MCGRSPCKAVFLFFLSAFMTNGSSALLEGELLGRSGPVLCLEGGLLALEATAASPTSTAVAKAPAATTTTSTATTVAKATAATTTSTSTTVAKATTATATAEATASIVGATGGVVETNRATGQVSTLQSLNDLLGIIDGVKGDVTEALEATSLPVRWSACRKVR